MIKHEGGSKSEGVIRIAPGGSVVMTVSGSPKEFESKYGSGIVLSVLIRGRRGVYSYFPSRGIREVVSSVADGSVLRVFRERGDSRTAAYGVEIAENDDEKADLLKTRDVGLEIEKR